MPPKAMSQAAIERLITQRVNAVVEAERARQVNAGGQGSNANEAGGQGRAPAVRECTFSGFMKCNPTVFHGHEGAVELSRWFEKTEMVFGISEYAEERKVKFAAATLQGHALTWLNSQVTTWGLEAANQIRWTEMKRLMTEEFHPIEEIQRMEHELWNLKVKSKPTSLNEAVRMAHTLIGANAQLNRKDWPKALKENGKGSQGGNNEPKEKHLEDVLVIRDFPEVFPDDLPGLPPPRQVEFKIELVPGAAPVARAPYRLAPSEMKELADQLQELNKKGFYSPVASSPWGGARATIKKKRNFTERVSTTGRSKPVAVTPNRYPHPRIDDLFDHLQGLNVYSKD
ncbi:putative reverse transcriptase domain-containing protein [Tanacetum coccineum]|uniref:Reverse transcriptase domain-containing protein n=1 Tax=Tanacetum coccineum TaxID=301880 RepID=A0ABQ5GR93_9ASTR